MRILFLTHRLPYAPDRGDRIRAFHILRTLAGHATVDLLSFVHDEVEQTRVGDLRDLVRSVRTVRVSRLRNLSRAALRLHTSQPLTHLLLDAPGLDRLLRTMVVSHPPDVVLAYCSGMARLAMAGPLESTPCVLDMVDTDSAKWSQLATTAPPPMRWVYQREARTLRRFEARAMAHARTTIAVNARERDLLQTIAPGADVAVVENGIDLSTFSPGTSHPSQPTVVFCGVMNYEPNAQGAVWLARRVWPAVRARVPAARLVLVGASPTAAVRSLQDPTTGVEVTGTVPDVRPYLWTAAAAAAPLHTARGIQNKVLEAMAAGLRCVVTSAVAEGLPPTVRGACQIADEPDRFAAALISLLELTEQQRRSLNPGAALSALDWRHTLEALPGILARAAGRR